MEVNKCKCPVCGYEKNIQSELDIRTLTSVISCPRCGEFVVTEQLWSFGFPEGSPLYILSGVLRHNHDGGGKPIPIYSATVDELISDRYPKSVPSIIRQLLHRLSTRTEHLGSRVDVDGEVDYPVGFCRNPDEFDYLLKCLQSQGWLQCQDFVGGRQYNIQVTPEGWIELETIDRHNPDNPRAFVAMWFSEEMGNPYKEGISPAIRQAGYDPVRIDNEHFLNKIDDEILGQIRMSRFVVVDFTGHRGGVYFEAGFALGLGIPVIWMCRESDKELLHFDTRQYPHIIWKDSVDLCDQLRNRILALIGQGPKKVTTTNA